MKPLKQFDFNLVDGIDFHLGQFFNVNICSLCLYVIVGVSAFGFSNCSSGPQQTDSTTVGQPVLVPKVIDTEMVVETTLKYVITNLQHRDSVRHPGIEVKPFEYYLDGRKWYKDDTGIDISELIKHAYDHRPFGRLLQASREAQYRDSLDGKKVRTINEIFREKTYIPGSITSDMKRRIIRSLMEKARDSI